MATKKPRKKAKKSRVTKKKLAKKARNKIATTKSDLTGETPEKPQAEEHEPPREVETATVAETEVEKPEPWHVFVRKANEYQVQERFVSEIANIRKKYQNSLADYCLLALFDDGNSISSYDLNKIFGALQRKNPNCDRDVLLLMLSPGGGVEPAYQISKICKLHSRNKFVVAIPRQAKSAATLIAIGADEIHMGPLSQLGPIDPQLGGLPALGVSQALKSIASLSAEFPGSADMFSKYLNQALTVEQIGYCERICESAAQYAQRLLSTKKHLPDLASKIANELVYEYKDHGFVIDVEEAKDHLGSDLVKSDTAESNFAEEVYRLYEDVNLWLRLASKKKLIVFGSFELDDMLIMNN